MNKILVSVFDNETSAYEGINVLKDTGALGREPAQTLPAWIKRDEWTRLPFGEFAQSVNERVEPSGAHDRDLGGVVLCVEPGARVGPRTTIAWPDLWVGGLVATALMYLLIENLWLRFDLPRG